MSISRIGAWTCSGVVVVAIIAGLALIGMPSEQRFKRLDERRVADLRRLTRSLYAYWDTHDRLPADLDVLLDGQHLSRMPLDPASSLPYEYQVDAPSRYHLCTRFDRSSSHEETSDFWAHEDGQRCYSFNVAGKAGKN